MKIVKTSNYDDENFTEEFVTGFTLLNNEYARKIGREICMWLNTIDPRGPDYYRLVEDDYILAVRKA